MNKQLMIEYRMATGLDPVNYDIDDTDDNPTQEYLEWLEEKATQRKFEPGDARKLILEIMKESGVDSARMIHDIERSDDTIGVIIWGVDDFIHKAKELTEDYGDEYEEEEMSGALKEMIHRHDCNYEITWDSVEYYLNENCKIENNNG